MARTQVTRGRAFDRLSAFSDGVVAVAATVLVLPLVDIAGPKPGSDSTVWDIMSANTGTLISFFVTFSVIVLLWLAHHRVLGECDAYDGRLLVLNTAWLVTVAFLPWPTNIIGESDTYGYGHGVGVLYFGTLAVNTLLLWGIAWHVQNTPEIRPADSPRPRNQTYRSASFAALWIILAVLSAIAPKAVIYVFPVMWVLLIIFTRYRAGKTQETGAEEDSSAI